MSECIYEIIDFPKYHRKNLIDFCPGRFYRLGTCDLFWLFSRRLYSGECITYLVWINFQGRTQIFSVVFWKIDDFKNTFWLHLTFNTNELINQPLQVFIQRRNIIVSRTLFIPLHKLKMYLLHSTLCHIIIYVLTYYSKIQVFILQKLWVNCAIHFVDYFVF